VIRGDKIKVTPNECVGDKDKIQISYETMLEDLDKGDTIFINDGIVKLVVEGREGDCLNCVVESGGLISNHKGCNIPSGNISLDVVTEKDKVDLEFIAKLNPEFVASSFVGTAKDVRSVKEYLKKFGNENVKIISKIERPVALENMEEILEETDGVMVARGDLGVEIPTWEVPVAQKRICKMCNAAGKVVIVATQVRIFLR